MDQTYVDLKTFLLVQEKLQVDEHAGILPGGVVSKYLRARMRRLRRAARRLIESKVSCAGSEAYKRLLELEGELNPQRRKKL